MGHPGACLQTFLAVDLARPECQACDQAGELLWQVIRYLRMIAVITPYAQFRFAYRAEDERNSVRFSFVRRTDKMPAPPTVRTISHYSML